jgi:hypothetical protein
VNKSVYYDILSKYQKNLRRLQALEDPLQVPEEFKGLPYHINYEDQPAEAPPVGYLRDPNLPTPATAGCANLEQCCPLLDVGKGWEGGCMDLKPMYGIKDMHACHKTCCDDWKCEVWQWCETGCWQGLAKDCSASRKDVTIYGGMMIQTGRMNTQNIVGKACLYLTEHKFGEGTALEQMVKCKYLCYADTQCTIWQSSKDGGCFYGETDELDCDVNYDGAENMVAGEIVSRACAGSNQAVCPGQIFNKTGPAPEKIPEDDSGWRILFWVEFAALLGALGAVGFLVKTKC